MNICGNCGQIYSESHANYHGPRRCPANYGETDNNAYDSLGKPRSVRDDNMCEDDLLALGFQMLSDDFES